VEDTGIGVADDELPRLFQEFGQLPNSRKSGQGTGLGLALTRHLVEGQGGSVGLRSILGQGSVFFAVLPLDAQATS
jgi:signal transduction histidine kinase